MRYKLGWLGDEGTQAEQRGGHVTGPRGIFLPVTLGNHRCGPKHLLKP